MAEENPSRGWKSVGKKTAKACEGGLRENHGKSEIGRGGENKEKAS